VQSELRILLVMPDAGIHRLSVGSLKMSFREAPLTLTTLAALVPVECPASIRIVDESVESIPFEGDFDLVGISCLTGTALRAYEIAGAFRQKGVPVVLGGVHVALCPDEASQHADTIVVGFAESAWPQLIRDVMRGHMKPRYQSKVESLIGLPHPRRELQKRWGYMMPNTVFATRGCTGSCDFCTVPAVPFGWQKRPVADVIDEIRQIPARRIAFNDVSPVEDVEYAKELFTALIPLNKKWGGLATTRVVEDLELLDLMARSGCQYLLLGFESVSDGSLLSIGKDFNRAGDYAAVMDALHGHDIVVQGCFIFGCEHDDVSVFEKTVQAVNDLKIDIPRFAIYTPFPGTAAFFKLESENRIIHKRWDHYDTQHVVFQPKQMSVQQLDEGFRWAYRKAFGMGSILRRTRGSRHFPITFVGNLAYRLYLRRLRNSVEERIYASDD
jgi:radical SAM superfamily enzyme YgiQ (UPF0313 family)